MSGPGKSYRKGITLVEAIQRFSDESEAEAWFIEQRWPNGIACPRCGSLNVKPRANRKPMPFHCGDCRKYFSAKTGTVLERSKVSMSKWVIGMFLFTTNIKGTPSTKLRRDIGVTQSTAWHMNHRIREALDVQNDKLTGTVEVDETYVGGKERNKHLSKRLRAGRGAVGKTAVVGIKERESKQVIAKVVPFTDGATLKGFIHDNTEPTAQVNTDEARAYTGMHRAHTRVRHSIGEYVRDMAHTNGIESHWALMKRGLSGVYHQVSAKHLQRYVNEFAGRHNLRTKDTDQMMSALATGTIGKRLTYKELIA